MPGFSPPGFQQYFVALAAKYSKKYEFQPARAGYPSYDFRQSFDSFRAAVIKSAASAASPKTKIQEILVLSAPYPSQAIFGRASGQIFEKIRVLVRQGLLL